MCESAAAKKILDIIMTSDSREFGNEPSDRDRSATVAMQAVRGDSINLPADKTPTGM